MLFAMCLYVDPDICIVKANFVFEIETIETIRVIVKRSNLAVETCTAVNCVRLKFNSLTYCFHNLKVSDTVAET